MRPCVQLVLLPQAIGVSRSLLPAFLLDPIGQAVHIDTKKHHQDDKFVSSLREFRAFTTTVSRRESTGHFPKARACRKTQSFLTHSHVGTVRNRSQDHWSWSKLANSLSHSKRGSACCYMLYTKNVKGGQLKRGEKCHHYIFKICLTVLDMSFYSV